MRLKKEGGFSYSRVWKGKFIREDRENEIAKALEFGGAGVGRPGNGGGVLIDLRAGSGDIRIE